ncbi:MAG: restriction endonuclease subunit S [Gammaproteobacteria bacterium]|nr:restriction endonuclease subunit S [Gammaproteobacteria bacterium]
MSIVKLEEITIKIGSGATPRGGKGAYKSQGISLIRSMNVYDSKFTYKNLAFIDDEQAQKLANVVVKENDVLLNITGASVARCCLVPKCSLPARVNQHVAIIRVDHKLADPRFVFLCLVSPKYKTQLLTYAQGGATREALTKTTIEEFEIEIPSIEKQVKIADVLTAYDNLIENNNRRIAILEDMAQSLYQEWFVKFRFPGHQNTKFKESSLGLIPEGWNVKVFTDIADVLGGGTPKTKEPSYWGGEIPFFAPRDAPDSFYATTTEKHVTELGIEKSSAKLYPKDTVFITARGTVGKVVLPSREMTMNQSCYALKAKNDISQKFLFLMTKTQVAYLKKNTGGATFDTIVTDTFKSMKVMLPLAETIQDFNKIIEPIFDQILNLINKNSNLKSQRDFLLPKLISGNIQL